MTRILVIEDSPTQAQELAMLLGDAGFEVEVASDATEGYKLATQGHFDLIMADVHLPDGNGFDLCRQLKAEARLKDTPVLIVTADSNPQNVLRGLEVDADGFMTKDRSSAEIVGRVQRTLAGGARQVRVGDLEYTQVIFQNTEFLLKATIEKLLNILLSGFEDVINLNERLKADQAVLLQLNEEIRSANQALEEANRLKDKFINMAAHDLRNPVGNINVMASMMLQNECEPNEQREFLNNIAHETEQVLVLLEDLLSASTMRDHRLDLKPVFQNPIGILRKAFDGFVLIARKKGLKLIWDVPSTLPSAELDTVRMTEVLSNLIANGVKFCAPGRSVSLAATAVDSHLEISVRDNGPGISPDEIPHLFEPFARLSNKPTAGEPSSGLGLSIVKQIVELHGGNVSVESAVGRGTTFKVLLPLHFPHAVAN
jgi:signal transduction histidine kinase